MTRDEIFESVQSLSQEQDLFAASAYVLGLADDSAIVEAFHHLIVDCHHKARSTEQVIHFGHGGVHYCLTRAAACEVSDPDAARQLRYAAKQMATNVASFTWPGWAEEGVTITPEQARQGLIFARYSVRQLHELTPSNDQLAFTYWFLGAQLLANGQYAEARRIFEQARQYAERQDNNADGVAMLRGYIGLTSILAGDHGADAETYHEAIAALKASGNADAGFYAQQLITARGVFEGQRDAGYM